MEKDNETFVSTERSSVLLIKETSDLLTSLNKTSCHRTTSQGLGETERLELLIKLEEKDQELAEMKEKLRRLIKSRTRKRNKAARRFENLALEVAGELKESKEGVVAIDRALKMIQDPNLGKDKPPNPATEEQKAEIIRLMKELQTSYAEEESALTEETGLVEQDKEERDKECEEAILAVKKRAQMVKLLSTRVKEALQRLRRRNPGPVAERAVSSPLRAPSCASRACGDCCE